MAQFNVQFPLFAKVEVNGPGALTLYKILRAQSSLQGSEIPWNFAKFLVTREGAVHNYYVPDTAPNAIVADIESLL